MTGCRFPMRDDAEHLLYMILGKLDDSNPLKTLWSIDTRAGRLALEKERPTDVITVSSDVSTRHTASLV
jgi:hypothetical protein